MADNPLKNYAVGILLFSLIILAGYSLFGEMISTNDTHISADDPYFESFQSLNISSDAMSETNEFSNSTNIIDGSSGGDGSFIDSLTGGAWSSVKNFGNSFGFMGIMFSSFAEVVGIPVWVAQTLTAIISIIITFAILQSLGFIRRT